MTEAESEHSIDDSGNGYVLTLPRQTPRGQPVDVQRGVRRGAHVMHAESPDQHELYVEVTSYPGTLDHAELVRSQHAFLTEQSSQGRIGTVGRGRVEPYDATTFDFEGPLQGRWKVRRFLFVDGAHRTYRIVFDPTSALNGRVLDTLRWIGADAS